MKKKAESASTILIIGPVGPEPSGTGPAVIGKAIAARIREDEVVEQGNAEEIRTLLQPNRELTVLLAW